MSDQIFTFIDRQDEQIRTIDKLYRELLGKPYVNVIDLKKMGEIIYCLGDTNKKIERSAELLIEELKEAKDV